MLKKSQLSLVLFLSTQAMAANDCTIYISSKITDTSQIILTSKGYFKTHSKTKAAILLKSSGEYNGSVDGYRYLVEHRASGFSQSLGFIADTKYSYVLAEENKETNARLQTARTVEEFLEIKSKLNPALDKVVQAQNAIDIAISKMPTCDAFYGQKK